MDGAKTRPSHEIDLSAEVEAALRRLESVKGTEDDVALVRVHMRQLEAQINRLSDDPDEERIKRTWRAPIEAE